MTLVFKKYFVPTFLEIFDDSDSFVNGYKASPLYNNELTDATLVVIYSLLVAKYGKNPIANKDSDLFKNKVYSVLFKYGPTWNKKLDLQKKLRALTDTELMLGTTTIYNRASNPEQAPTTDTLDELTYINDQNTQKFKKNKSQAYAELYSILRDDITDSFINQFRYCFRNIVAGDYVYMEEEEEDDE
jgi:hypothetical protein